jgi:hypothetical protein
MPERRGSRFVVEALFLAALTVALALAHLDALEIVGAMALGWIVVAALPAGPVEEEVRAISVVRVPTDGRTARYSLDPLGDPVPRRRFGRARSDRWESIEVAARPSRRAFPGSA